MNLSKNFTLEELIRSDLAKKKGIDNTPTEEAVCNLGRLCTIALQPLRDGLGPVIVSSGYRSPQLNTAVGSSLRSAHVRGLAADLTVKGFTPQEVCEWIVKSSIPYDQVIHEFGVWVHLGICAEGSKPRLQALTIDSKGTRVGILPARR